MKYFFTPESPIQQVSFITTETGGKRAYLFARKGSSADFLQELREKIAEKGYLTAPAEHNGQNALEVRKFPSSGALIDSLKVLNAVQGHPQVEHNESDRVGPWQWLKNNTYKSSLGLYLFGDIGYSIYGKSKEGFDVKALKTKNAQRKARSLPEYAPEPKNPYDKYAGWAYTAGTVTSIASTAMRGDQSDEEVEAISKDIQDHLKQQNGDVNASTTFKAIGDEAHKKGLEKAKTLFSKYPSELLNIAYAGAGLLLAVSAKKGLNAYKSQLKVTEKSLVDSETALQKLAKTSKTAGRAHLNEEVKTLQGDIDDFKKHIKVKKQDIALGAITLGSGVLATTVREKAVATDEPEPKGILQKTKRWFEEKPLRIAGIGYLVSTVIHLFSTTSDYSRIAGTAQKEQKIIDSGKKGLRLDHAKTNLKNTKIERNITHGRMLFVVTNIIAEVLLALSSKGHGDGVLSDDTVKKSAMNIAAENIALQDKEARPELIKKMATHLASPKIMGGSAYIIEKGLQTKVDELANNPWSDTFQQTPDQPATR